MKRQLDPTTLSRMENAGAKPVGGATRNLHAVLDVLRPTELRCSTMA